MKGSVAVGKSAIDWLARVERNPSIGSTVIKIQNQEPRNNVYPGVHSKFVVFSMSPSLWCVF